MTRSLAERYPPATRGRIVVWGLLGARPFGGMTWQVLHYVVGLRRLGFDVWYVEDSERKLRDPERFWTNVDATPNIEFLSRHMKSVGLADRWIFRHPEAPGGCVGAADRKGLAKLYEEADAVLNLCGAQELRPDHDCIRCLIYLQTDPTADQVRIANGDPEKRDELDAYHHLFTYGENLGAPDCLVPIERYRWHKTRPPVCIDWWNNGRSLSPEAGLTTITNWKRFTGKDVVWRGETWGWNKRDEIDRFIDLPNRSSLPMGLAIGNIDEQDRAMLRGHGWRLVSATDLGDPHAYRDYIRNSLGEFTIAKEQYVRPRTGWFSDRSVCYLAAGRPVITQDTGFGSYVATGKGLFAFSTEQDALDAIETIAGDYSTHSIAASEIAREFFDAEVVLGEMLDTAGLA